MPALSNLSFVSTFHLSHSYFSFSQLFCKSTPVDELTGSGSCFSPVKEFGVQADSVSLRDDSRRRSRSWGLVPRKKSESYEGEGSGMPEDVSAQGE